MTNISNEDSTLCRNILRALNKTWKSYDEGFLTSSFGSSFQKNLITQDLNVDKGIQMLISENRDSEEKLTVDFLVNDRFPICLKQKEAPKEADVKKMREILHHLNEPEGLIVNLEASDFFDLYRRVRQ